MAEEHNPTCPPESRCSVCWFDDDEIIKALVVERDEALELLNDWYTTEAMIHAALGKRFGREAVSEVVFSVCGPKEHNPQLITSPES